MAKGWTHCSNGGGTLDKTRFGLEAVRKYSTAERWDDNISDNWQQIEIGNKSWKIKIHGLFLWRPFFSMALYGLNGQRRRRHSEYLDNAKIWILPFGLWLTFSLIRIVANYTYQLIWWYIGIFLQSLCVQFNTHEVKCNVHKMNCIICVLCLYVFDQSAQSPTWMGETIETVININQLIDKNQTPCWKLKIKQWHLFR